MKKTFNLQEQFLHQSSLSYTVTQCDKWLQLRKAQ